jgi:predicted acetyltransferase
MLCFITISCGTILQVTFFNYRENFLYNLVLYGRWLFRISQLYKMPFFPLKQTMHVVCYTSSNRCLTKSHVLNKIQNRGFFIFIIGRKHSKKIFCCFKNMLYECLQMFIMRLRVLMISMLIYLYNLQEPFKQKQKISYECSM